MQITHSVNIPQTALCHAFCSHYAALTGTGLATARPAPASQEKDGDQ